MIYLLSAALSSTLTSVIMRLSEKHVKNNMVFFTSNYCMCIILSLIFQFVDASSQVEAKTEGGLAFALFLGGATGILYLLGFVLLQINVGRNGVAMAATFMRLGVLVPTIMAVVVFREVPGIFQIAGFLLAIAAILIINIEPGKKDGIAKSSPLLLFALLLVGGAGDSISNLFDKFGAADKKNIFLLSIFVSAMLISVVMAIIKKQKITIIDIVWGAAIGIPNYFSARLLLLALGQLPAIVVYPVDNVLIILAVALIGVIAFKEKLALRKWIGIGMIAVSLVFLNL